MAAKAESLSHGRGWALERLGLMTRAQVVQAYSVSKSTLRALEQKGVLHTVTPAGMSRPVLYRQEELDAWVGGAA